MNIDWVVISSKVPEAVIVLIFVGFTLKILNVFQKFLIARDASYFASLQAVGNMHNKEIETLSTDIQEQTNVIQEQTTVMTKVVDQMSNHTKILEFIAEDARKRNTTN